MWLRERSSGSHAGGRRETVRARWLIGCDGGHSRVRDAAGLRLDRSDAGATFVLADVKTTAALPEDEGYLPEGRRGPRWSRPPICGRNRSHWSYWKAGTVPGPAVVPGPVGAANRPRFSALRPGFLFRACHVVGMVGGGDLGQMRVEPRVTSPFQLVTAGCGEETRECLPDLGR
ncbi:FAD-dependent monooxygenase [Streptomyces sp. NPDC002587]